MSMLYAALLTDQLISVTLVKTFKKPHSPLQPLIEGSYYYVLLTKWLLLLKYELQV